MRIALVALAAAAVLYAHEARAACGCMLVRDPNPTATAKSARITNSATKVVLMRRGDKTTVVMSNDFDGDVQEFGLVVPVPAVVQKRDVRLVDPSLFARLEKATAPRIVKLEEQDPCGMWGDMRLMGLGGGLSAAASVAEGEGEDNAKSLGVVAKSKFAVGEYDITVLSAEQSTGLLTWLEQNGYRVPKEAADVLASYIAQKNYFLVAKVDARRLSRSGRSFLKPLLVRFDTPKLMLPIRLGMVNNDGLQELLVFAFADGRVEPTNYRAARLDAGQAVPGFVADDADAAFEAIFATATAKNDTRAVFTEWAGNLSTAGLLPTARRLDVVQSMPQGEPRVDAAVAAVKRCPAPNEVAVNTMFNVIATGTEIRTPPIQIVDEATKECFAKALDVKARMNIRVRVVDDAPAMFATRLHFRYDEARFPEDLVLQVTKDRTTIRSKWYARVPWAGEAKCTAATKYLAISDEQLDKEIATWSSLSGTSVDAVKARVKSALH